MASYDEGDLLRVSAVFTNTAGTAIDPTTVKFRTKSLSGITTLTYGVDSAVIKDSVGNYHADVSLARKGDWWLRVESTGTGQAAEEVKIRVKSAF